MVRDAELQFLVGVRHSFEHVCYSVQYTPNRRLGRKYTRTQFILRNLGVSFGFSNCRRDSDIVYPYGMVLPKDPGKVCAVFRDNIKTVLTSCAKSSIFR